MRITYFILTYRTEHFDAIYQAKLVDKNSHPLDYIRSNISNDNLRVRLAQIIAAGSRQIANEDGFVVVATPSDGNSQMYFARGSGSCIDQQQEVWGPTYLAFRTPSDFLDSDAIKDLQSVVANEVEGGGFEPPVPHKKDCPRVSDNVGVAHLGVWGHYFNPRPTADTDQQPHGTVDTTATAMRAMQQRLAPRLVNWLRRFDPLVYQFRQL
jgi:hypothetical protein